MLCDVWFIFRSFQFNFILLYKDRMKKEKNRLACHIVCMYISTFFLLSLAVRIDCYNAGVSSQAWYTPKIKEISKEVNEEAEKDEVTVEVEVRQRTKNEKEIITWWRVTCALKELMCNQCVFRLTSDIVNG